MAEDKTTLIRNVLRQLDPENEDHWTQTGAPAMMAVVEMAEDEGISRAQERTRLRIVRGRDQRRHRDEDRLRIVLHDLDDRFAVGQLLGKAVADLVHADEDVPEGLTRGLAEERHLLLAGPAQGVVDQLLRRAAGLVADHLDAVLAIGLGEAVRLLRHLLPRNA